jgi:hypothetical protein
MDVRQQYPFVFFLTIDRESMERCFLYACYGNPYLLQNSGKAYRQHATFYTDQFVVYEGVIPGAQHRAISKVGPENQPPRAVQQHAAPARVTPGT